MFKNNWFLKLGLGFIFISLGLTQSVYAQSASSTKAETKADSSKAESKAAQKVESNLHEKFPKLVLQGFKPLDQVKGLYEFSVNGQKAYTNSNIDYVLVGEILVKDGDKVVNVTQSSIEKDKSQLFTDLPKERAIKIVYGNGERKLALFEDPHCPFCQNFEHELAQKGDALNATVYVFLFPLESIHPGATKHAEYIWCSKDRAEAWKSWMTFGDEHRNQDPNQVWDQWLAQTGRPAKLDCGDAGVKLVEGNIDLGHSYGFHQTPILLFANGSMWPQALSMEKLEKAFDYVEKSK